MPELATTPNADLVIANVAGNGKLPMGPMNAEPLGQPIENGTGQVMISASALATGKTSPKINWVADDSLQWHGISIAFKPTSTD